MTQTGISTVEIEANITAYCAGVVAIYALPSALEAIVLRVVTAEGGDPQGGGEYVVEFRHPKTRELLEVLEQSDRTHFNVTTIDSVMDDLAEEYLRATARDQAAYISQSGRCDADEINILAAGSGEVEKVVIRGATKKG